jgi:hypothetical protein
MIFGHHTIIDFYFYFLKKLQNHVNELGSSFVDFIFYFLFYFFLKINNYVMRLLNIFSQILLVVEWLSTIVFVLKSHSPHYLQVYNL